VYERQEPVSSRVAFSSPGLPGVQFNFQSELKANNLNNEFITNGTSGGSITYGRSEPPVNEFAVSNPFLPILEDTKSNTSLSNCVDLVFEQRAPVGNDVSKNNPFNPNPPEDNLQFGVKNEIKTENTFLNNCTSGGSIMFERKNQAETPHQIDNAALAGLVQNGALSFQNEIKPNTDNSDLFAKIATETNVTQKRGSGSNSPNGGNCITVNRDDLVVSSTVTTEVRVSSANSSSSTSPLLMRKQDKFSFRDQNANNVQIDINVHNTFTTSRLPESNHCSNHQNIYNDGLVLQRAHEEVDDCGWYYKGMTESEAVNKLQNSREGTFLLRDSSRRDVCYCLSIQTDEGPRSIRISFDRGSFRFAPHRVDENQIGKSSVLALVEEYVVIGKLWVIGSEDPEYGRYIRLSKPFRKNVQTLQHLVRLSYNSHRMYKYPNIPNSVQTFLDSYAYSI